MYIIHAWVGAVDFENDYDELKSYCQRISYEVPNYAKANGDGATAFGALGGEKFQNAVEKINA